MPRLLRLAGWIQIVLTTLLAVAGGASTVLGPLFTGGERALTLLALIAGWLMSAAIGASLVGFARILEDLRAVRERLEQDRTSDALHRHAFEPLGMGLLHSPTGVAIHSVAADGLAARVGLRKGDLVVAVNGTRLTTFASHEERVNAIAYSRPARLQVLRDDGEIQISLR